jgi:hypothetical protein
VHTVESIQQWLTGTISYSEDRICLTFEGVDDAALNSFREVYHSTSVYQGESYSGNPSRYICPEEPIFLEPFGANQFKPSRLAQSFCHDREDGPKFLGPWFKISDYDSKSNAIATSARLGYDSMRKYFVRFFLVKEKWRSLATRLAEILQGHQCSMKTLFTINSYLRFAILMQLTGNLVNEYPWFAWTVFRE